MTVASQVNQTLASLKGIRGTLRTYARQSQVQEERRAYEEALKTTSAIIKDLQKRIKFLEYEEPQFKGF